MSDVHAGKSPVKCFSPELLHFTTTERLQEFLRAPDSCFNCRSMVLDFLAEKQRAKAYRKDAEQVYALLAVGWTFEIPSVWSDPLSFYWRAPPKGKRALGRRYLSTNQAFNAMNRSKNDSDKKL